MSALFLAAAVLAVLELDESMVGQFMLSRPIVAGIALGAAFSEVLLGASLGLFYEIFSLDDLPVGGYLPLNAPVAAAAALLLALGPSPVAPALAVPVGLAFGWAHARLDTRLRRRRDGLGRRIEGRMKRGQTPGLGRLAAGECLRQAGMTFGMLLAALAMRPLLERGWPLAPAGLREGLSFGLLLSPWLGAAALIHSARLAW